MKSAKDVYIFVGPPGSGKGSLSNRCVQELGWVQLSTGNLCRKHIAQKSLLGQNIEQAIKAGKLVPDELILHMVWEWFLEQVHHASHPLILDGFPRTLIQAKDFLKLLKKESEHIPLKLHVIRFIVPAEKVVQRISGRLVCQNRECQAVYSDHDTALKPRTTGVCDVCKALLGRRKDDEPETIRERLRTYYLHEEELVNFYLNSGYSVLELDATKPLHEVFQDFKKMIGFEEA